MNRLSCFAIASALLAAGCGSSTTSPSNQNTVLFTTTVLPANENPPIGNAENTGSGTMTITFHLTRDGSGNITAGTADFAGSFSGFPAGTSLTAAHIHGPADAKTNAPVLISTQLQSGDVTMPAGSGSLNKTNITITPVELAGQIINNPGNYYFNIHTQQNPGGVARGQLVKQ
jgi:hypothetical protein